MASLSKEEQEALLLKIREQYEHYADEYNDKAFDLKAFNRRYTHVYVNKGNMASFLLAEVAFLEELKDALEGSLLKKTALERSMEEMSAKIAEKWQHYPRINFHPAADDEIRHFYGAAVTFCEVHLPLIHAFFRGTPEGLSLDSFIRAVEDFGVMRSGQSRRFNEYIQILSVDRQNAEKGKQHIMRDTAIALKDFVTKVEAVIHEEYTERERERLAKTSIKYEWNQKTEYESLIKSLTTQNALQQIQTCIEYALNIIENFRLAAIINMKLR